MSETELVKAIVLEIGARFPQSVRAWRNNTGALKDENGRLVRFGLEGSADISGIISGGRRLEIEVKTTKGRLSEMQIRFGNMINGMGGLWVCVRSVSEAVEALNEALG